VILYLYAIAEGLGDVSGIAGIGGEALELATFDSLTVVTGQLAASPSVDRDTLASQDRVVRALHDRAAALLPMRFGAAFGSTDDAAHAIRTQASGLRERITAVTRREQMTLRITRASDVPGVVDSPAPSASGASGADYLRARARPREIAPLLDGVQHLVRGTIVERGKTAGVVATVYHLVERGTSHVYRDAVIAAAATTPALSVHVSGPSPCYAFT
jgi:hypothetical protein